MVEATQLAVKLAEATKIVGTLAVELFLDKEGNLLVNESAPRVHNSGHLSIEACYT
ncbi:ATP-grasp domain-containing protein [Arthrospira sp. PCC 8006]|uniref:ATP-grasp domain-containing protein n=1 Tax=Arthrospira sp. PCC 8006 TaxID=1982224 RepID=UPI00396F4134